MKAIKILSEKQVFRSTFDKEVLVSVHVEIFRIPDPDSKNYPEGLRVSMVAYKNSAPDQIIIVDCHPPKGPHFHSGLKEESFVWKSLDETYALFWGLVETEFGAIEEVE
ncbi:MAG: hypothetical protein ACOYOK_12425 [Pseudobdellovibrionaceae bacterium]